MMGKFWYVLTCLFMMLLAGCGSGGGDEAAQTPDTPTPPLAALSIYDPVTGLRWQKFENSARQDWAGAKAFCDGLLMEGYAWRLPTARELLSAVDFQRSNPATSILPSAYSAYYWAGTEPLYGTSKEWHVDFTSGYVYKEDPATLSYVRCVSGPVLSYHHLDNGNGTVSSPETGLMWQKQTSLTEHNWYEATGTPHVGYNPGSTDVCGTMALAGYDDWRVPNIPELSTIINFGDASDPAIDTDLFPTPWLSDFWSSTVPFAGYAWYSRSD